MVKARKTNNGMFYVVISLVAVLAIGLMVKAYSGGSPTTVIENIENVETLNDIVSPSTTDESLGAAAGTNHYFAETFHAGFGGELYASSTVGAAYTLKSTDLDTYNVFEFKPYYAEDYTITFPATTTVPRLLEGEGYNKQWIFRNATTTETVDMAVAAGTGWHFMSASSTSPLSTTGSAGAENLLILDCYRGQKASALYDIYCWVTEAMSAD